MRSCKTSNITQWVGQKRYSFSRLRYVQENTKSAGINFEVPNHHGKGKLHTYKW